MLLLGEGSEATEPYNKYANLLQGPHLVRSFQAGCMNFIGTTLSQEYRNQFVTKRPAANFARLIRIPNFRLQHFFFLKTPSFRRKPAKKKKLKNGVKAEKLIEEGFSSDQ